MKSTLDRFKDVKKIGGNSIWTQDFYHNLLTMQWRYFFLVYVGLFILFNAIFAFIYWSQADSLVGTDNSYWQAFVFSVQTFSTIGYGVFSPQTTWAHGTMVVEAILSVFVTALLTGLIFSKFSRPTAKILFSKNILIHQFNGQKVLTLRMGNMRSNLIAEAQVRIVALKSLVTPEKQTLRQQLDLKLVRDSSLFFALTWSVMHIIDENSPIYNMSHDDLLKQNVEFGVSVIGNDSSFSQTVHASCIYSPEDVVFDRYFTDIVNTKNGSAATINYKLFHELKA